MEKEQIIICPHCGNKTPQKIKCVTSLEEELFDDKGEHIAMVEIYDIFVQCKTCKKTSLFNNWEAAKDPFNLEESELLYPSKKELSDGVPEDIKKSYLEAKKIEKASPIAFAVLIRRAFEYICKDKKAKGRNLKEKLDYLVRKEVMPTTLFKMATVLKSLGNIGAHANDFEIDLDKAKVMDNFFIAIIEYVYIAPEKIKKLEEGLKKI